MFTQHTSAPEPEQEFMNNYYAIQDRFKKQMHPFSLRFVHLCVRAGLQFADEDLQGLDGADEGVSLFAPGVRRKARAGSIRFRQRQFRERQHLHPLLMDLAQQTLCERTTLRLAGHSLAELELQSDIVRESSP